MLLVESLPRAIAAALTLQLFFGLVRTKWPASYYASTDLVSDSISRTWYRFALFRFGPVFVAAMVVSLTGRPDMSEVLASALIFGIIHASLTAGRALVLSAYRQLLSLRQGALDSAIFAVSMTVALIGGLASPLFRSYVPGFDKYIEVLLTGAVAALVYAYLSRWTQPSYDQRTADERLREIPARLLDMTVDAAARNRVDRDLALAVLMTELQQRPAWFRVAEKATKRVSKTHGPFQNLRDPSASDHESVEMAMENLRGSVLSRESYGPRIGRLEAEIERHNRSRVFVESCSEVFHLLSGSASPASDSTGSDGSPSIRMLSRRRIGYEWVLLGDISDGHERLYAAATQPVDRSYPVTVQAGRFGRKLWKVVASVDDTQVFVGLSNQSNEGGRADTDEAITVYL